MIEDHYLGVSSGLLDVVCLKVQSVTHPKTGQHNWDYKNSPLRISDMMYCGITRALSMRIMPIKEPK